MVKEDLSAKADVFFNCIEKKYFSKRMSINQHAFVSVISGEMKIIQADHTYVFRAGDTFLIPRNQLARVTKYPADGQPYRAVSVYFTLAFLRKYYASQKAGHNNLDIPKIKLFDRHPLLDSLFNSLLPYFSLSDELPAAIAAGKVQEAITILRTIDPDIDHILGHFEEPGKIDLEDFMEKNYMFNMTAEKFGYLTGRSLTTFKKDFKKIFSTTPQKWLTRKRLELAHYQIFEGKQKPSAVYFEAGFENLSHFSFAFKKQFGYNPTRDLHL
jgi:AraC-like DNA-binding protein